MANFLEATFVTSTAGPGPVVRCAFAVAAEDTGFVPHELQKQAMAARTMLDRITIRLMKFLHVNDSNFPSVRRRNRFWDPPGRAKAISLRLVPGPSKIPVAGIAAVQ